MMLVTKAIQTKLMTLNFLPLPIQSNSDEIIDNDIFLSSQKLIRDRIRPLWMTRKDADAIRNRMHQILQQEKKDNQDDGGGSGRLSVKDSSYTNKGKEKEKIKEKQNQEKEKKKESTNSNPKFKKEMRTLQNISEHSRLSLCPSLPQGRNNAIKPSVTLVLQTTVDRVYILEETCERWDGPMVIVLYLSSASLSSKTNSLENKGKKIVDEAEEMSRITGFCPNAVILSHVSDEGYYPVNVLRNIGLDAVVTTHVMILDADFIPSKDLYKIISTAITIGHDRNEKSNNERNAIVVPAFERKTKCNTIDECRMYMLHDPGFIPGSFEDLQECITDEECIVFQSDMNWEGHFDTKSERWMAGDWYDDEETMVGENKNGGVMGVRGGGGEGGSKGGDNNNNKIKNKVESKTKIDESKRFLVDPERALKSLRCFHSNRYEPYVVVPWCPTAASPTSPMPSNQPVSPYYDERFFGYGKNKIQMIAHLRMSGYKFSILPRGFVTHHPHPESSMKKEWSKGGEKGNVSLNLHREMDTLYQKYWKQLLVKYKKVVKTPMCKRK